MKNYFSAIILLIIVFFSSCTKHDITTGDLITEQESYYINDSDAIKIALEIRQKTKGGQILMSSNKRGQVKEQMISSYREVRTANDQAALHIYNYEGGGFIVLSADRRTQAVLAYSEENTFEISENMSVGVSLWLDEMVALVEEVRLSNKNTEKDYLSEIKKFIVLFGEPDTSDNPHPGDPICTGHYVVYDKMLTTFWAQKRGFNNNMPLMPICGIPPFPPLDPENNGRAHTGCVATAMAQIMRYHEHPNTYNYSIMPDIVNATNYTSAGTNEIAKLMFDAAESLPSDYDCDATGAAFNNQDIVDAFQNHFGYASSAYKTSYNFETVKSEIRNGRPVILTAYRKLILGVIPSKGHAWVADGYVDSFTCTDPYNSFDGYGIAMLHMNWGHDNNGTNGWFYSHTWAPSESINYQYNKQMVVGIQPQ